MAESQRRTSRPPRAAGGGDPNGEGGALDAARKEIDGILDAAEQTLDSVGRNVAESQVKDQVPPGTFHVASR